MKSELDILKEKAEQVTDASAKIDLLNKYSEKLRSVNIESSLNITRESIELGKTSDNKKGLARAYWNYAICCRFLALYDEAFQNFNRALLVYDEIDDPAGKARVLNSMANVFISQSDYKNALKYLTQSLSITDSIDDKNLKSLILSNFGLVYQETGDYPTSLEYYLKSMQINTELDSKIPENLYNNIGIVYQGIGDYPTALDYYFKGLEISENKNNNLNKAFTLGNIAITYMELQDYDNSLKYFRESLNIVKNLGYKQAEVNALSNLGNAYKQSGNYEKALEYQKQALKFSEELNDNSSKAQSLIYIGGIHSALEEYDAAKKHYLESLEISRAIGDKKNETENYLQLGQLFYDLNDEPSALRFLSQALELAESRHASKEILEIHKALYKVYEKSGNSEKALEHHKKLYSYEKEIANINSDKKIKSLIIQNQILNRDKEAQLAVKEKEIYRLKNVELAKANDKLHDLNEEIKEFLGFAVHDLRNPLSGILSFAKKIHNEFERYDEKAIRNFAHEMEKASERMFDLISKLLNINAIESGNRQFTFNKIDANYLAESVIRENSEKAFSKNIKINYFRAESADISTDKTAAKEIIDNLLSNAIKYSKPGKSVTVSLIPEGPYINVSVKDEGPGLTEKDKLKIFNKFARLSAQPTGDENSTGLGLYIVKKLAQTINSRISFNSEKDKGAEFIVEFPKAD